MSIIGAILRPIVERSAKGQTYTQLAQKLTTSGDEVAQRFARAADTPKNRQTMNHIIGIERWGQRRLRSALGEPTVSDEYDGYRLPADSSKAQLVEAFTMTRRETLALARQLEQAGAPLSRTVPHNSVGDLSIGGWLAYLAGHAGREAGRMKLVGQLT